jgi:hypothetical protein
MSSPNINWPTVLKNLQIQLHRTECNFRPSHISVLTSKVAQNMGRRIVRDKGIGRRANIESRQLMSNLFRFTGIQYATGVLCDTSTQNVTFPSIADLRKHKGATPWHRR